MDTVTGTSVLQQPAHPSAVFAGEHRGRDIGCLWSGRYTSAPICSLLSSRNIPPSPPQPVDQQRDRMLIGKEFCDLRFEVDFLKIVFPELRLLRKDVLFVHVAVQRILINLRQLVFVVVLQQGRWIRVNLRRLSVENDFPRQLTLPGVEILLFLEWRYGDNFGVTDPWVGGTMEWPER